MVFLKFVVFMVSWFGGAGLLVFSLIGIGTFISPWLLLPLIPFGMYLYFVAASAVLDWSTH